MEKKVYELRYSHEKDKFALFHISSGKRISDWFDEIYFREFNEGRSNYYRVRDNDKFAVFSKEGENITGWHHYIPHIGLPSGESTFYVVGKIGKQAIFDINRNFVLGWYYRIDWKGILKSQSSYCVCVKDDKDYKHTIVDINNNILIDVFDWIFSYGLIEGTSNLFIGQKKDKIGIFDLKGNLKSDLMPFTLENLNILKMHLKNQDYKIKTNKEK